MLAFAYFLSERKQSVQFRIVAKGVAFQFLIAFVFFKFSGIRHFFSYFNDAVFVLQEATNEGTRFVFGYLAGGPMPFDLNNPSANFLLAFQALPLILVMSALTALLYYLRVLPFLVHWFSWCLQKIMGIGGAIGLGASANVFIGMIEAPLLIKPYLKDLTRSELFALMTCGMSTIAGTVMALYGAILSSVMPDAIGHILIASLMSAPAALVISHIMIPEKSTDSKIIIPVKSEANSIMDAITIGTKEGLALILNIIAMLIVFVALVALLNKVLFLLPNLSGEPVSLQRILGFVMSPLVWLMGIPWSECLEAGSLMGVKTVLNEFIAYIQLSQLGEGVLSDRSRMILTYAMCGFANFGGLGIMLGGLSQMVPDRRKEIVILGMRSMFAGTLATSLTGAVIGIVY